MADFNVLDYGAAGDGISNDAAAIQKAIDACNGAGGGRVLIPSGSTLKAGSFNLKTNVEFHVERGALLLASPNQEDYGSNAFGHTPHEGSTWIGGTEAHNVAITGGGVINGQAKAFMVTEEPYIFRGTHWRPHMFVLEGCKNLTVRDITLRDAANWALHLSGCEDVVIHGIRILNDLKVPNCDGIDPDHCRNVRISDCHIEAGDDCIVIKTREEFNKYGPSENITVTGCTMISTSCAIKIGTESCQDIRNIVFDSCVIRSSHRGLGIMLRDAGNVENVLFNNMVIETRLFHEAWWGKAEPIYVTAIHRKQGAPLGQIRNVRFTNILCRGENGVFVAGSPDSLPEGILLENVRVEIDKWSKWPGGVQDRRPCDQNQLVEARTAGFWLENARDVTLRNCEAVWGANIQPYFGHAIESHGVRDLRLENYRGIAAHPHKDEPTRID